MLRRNTPATSSYLDDLTTEDFITLLLFCSSKRRKMQASSIIYTQLPEPHLTPTGGPNKTLKCHFYPSSPLCAWAPSLESHQQGWLFPQLWGEPVRDTRYFSTRALSCHQAVLCHCVHKKKRHSFYETLENVKLLISTEKLVHCISYPIPPNFPALNCL